MSTTSPSPPPAPCGKAAWPWTWPWSPAPAPATIWASSAAAPASACPGEPSEGWLAYAYDYARRLLYPEKTGAEPFAPGAVFLLSVLQVLFAAEAELLPHDPAWTFDFPTEEELSGCTCAASLGQKVFVRDGTVEAVAPSLQLELIEI